MANDTSINRSSASDAVAPANRKKQTPQGFDFSQQSFFEELLTIGQFESTIPEATPQPLIKQADNDRKAESDSDKELASKSDNEQNPSDDAANASQVQAAAAVQAIVGQVQPPTAQTNPERASGDEGDKTLIQSNNKVKKPDGRASGCKAIWNPTNEGSSGFQSYASFRNEHRCTSHCRKLGIKRSR